MGEVALDILPCDPMWDEGTVRKGSVGEGHCDIGDIGSDFLSLVIAI
jgi:hypothetical protein